MSNDVILKLSELFVKFPGVGPRQAKRFVYFLLNQHNGLVQELQNNLGELKSSVSQCLECFRFFVIQRPDLKPESQRSGLGVQCDLCSNQNSDPSQLLIIEKDADLENIKKTGKYQGKYFVLGGLVPILEQAPESKIRIRELLTRIKKLPKLKEIILALSANPVGDNTIEYLQDKLSKLNIKISVLGKGISTGAELEYADSATLVAALASRR